MKRKYTASAAVALALSVAATPLALAQTPPGQHDQHDQHTASPQGQHSAPQHVQAQHVQVQHMATPQHAQVQHTTVQHAQVQHMPVQHNTVQHAQVQHTTVQHVQVHNTTVQHVQVAGHQWRHGDHFNGNRQVVDWHHYHEAYAPPAGYEWVQDDDQLVLISVASGIIAAVLANALYQ